MRRCAICGEIISGMHDIVTAITAREADGVAHFKCYYPNGDVKPEPVNQFTYDYIKQYAPDFLAHVYVNTTRR